MTFPCLTLALNTPDETASLAARIADQSLAGDVILLDGPVGAGKTHFARHFIRSVQDRPEDVPSPTYTIVQTYHTRKGDVWHADLYRITQLDELEELGLSEAFEHDISLIEWPERLGPEAPAKALRLSLAATDDAEARVAGLTWTDARWNALRAVLAP